MSFKEQLDLFQVPSEPICDLAQLDSDPAYQQWLMAVYDLAQLDSDPAYQQWLMEQAESFCEFD